MPMPCAPDDVVSSTDGAPTPLSSSPPTGRDGTVVAGVAPEQPLVRRRLTPPPTGSAAVLQLCDAARVRGSVRVFLCLLHLLDSAALNSALALRLSHELVASADPSAVRQRLHDHGHRTLLVLSRRLRAYAAVLAFMDCAALVSARGFVAPAEFAELVAAADARPPPSLSTLPAQLLLGARRRGCAAVVMSWLPTFVAAHVECRRPFDGSSDAVGTGEDANVAAATPGPAPPPWMSALAAALPTSIDVAGTAAPVPVLAARERLTLTLQRYGVSASGTGPASTPSAEPAGNGEEDGAAVDSDRSLFGFQMLLDLSPSLRRAVHDASSASTRLRAAVALKKQRDEEEGKSDEGAAGEEGLSARACSGPPIGSGGTTPPMSPDRRAAAVEPPHPASTPPMRTRAAEAADASIALAAASPPPTGARPVLQALPSPQGGLSSPLVSRRAAGGPAVKRVAPTLLSGPSGSMAAGPSAGTATALTTVDSVPPTSSAAASPLASAPFLHALDEAFLRKHPPLQRLLDAVVDVAVASVLARYRAGRSCGSAAGAPPANGRPPAATVDRLASEAADAAAQSVATAAICAREQTAGRGLVSAPDDLGTVSVIPGVVAADIARQRAATRLRAVLTVG
jgi:hypothetical protein